MTQILFANLAIATLGASLPASGTGSTTLLLASGTGTKFPNPGAGQAFLLTISDAATDLVTEIVLCTARSGDTCTVQRAQEGTAALAWATGSNVQNRLTAGTQARFDQTAQAPPMVQAFNNGLGPYTIPYIPDPNSIVVYNGPLALTPPATYFSISGSEITFTVSTDITTYGTFTLYGRQYSS